MKTPKQASLMLPFLLSFLLICLSQSHVNAQDFLKRFLSNSSIKSGKQFKSDGNYPSAITKFTKSIKRNPENLEAYYQLGLIFENVMHDYDKAISLYKNVIMLSDGVKPIGTDEELKLIFRAKNIPQILIYTFPNSLSFKNFPIPFQIECDTFSIAFMRNYSEKVKNKFMLYHQFAIRMFLTETRCLPPYTFTLVG